MVHAEFILLFLSEYDYMDPKKTSAGTLYFKTEHRNFLELYSSYANGVNKMGQDPRRC